MLPQFLTNHQAFNMDYAAVKNNWKKFKKVQFSETVRIVWVENWIVPDAFPRQREKSNMKMSRGRKNEVQGDATSYFDFNPQVVMSTMTHPVNCQSPVPTRVVVSI